MRRQALFGLWVGVLFVCVVASCATIKSPVPVLEDIDQAATALYEKSKPGIVIVLQAPPRGMNLLDPQELQHSALVLKGTGIIVTPDGYIVTNHHVVRWLQFAVVQLADGSRYVAWVVGFDALTDLAVLKINAGRPLPYLTWSRNPARVGQMVFVIGHPISEVYSMSIGIVSGVDRYIHSPFVDFIQTDAAINSGNSGGPLFNTRGEVLGMNTSVVPYTKDIENTNARANPIPVQGIAFAVPAQLIRQIIPLLIADGRVHRGYLGLSLRDEIKAKENAVSVAVDEVKTKGPSAKTGIRVGDAILRLNGQTAISSFKIFKTITAMLPGTNVTLEVLKLSGAHEEVAVTLGEMPDNGQ